MALALGLLKLRKILCSVHFIDLTVLESATYSFGVQIFGYQEKKKTDVLY